MWCEKPLGEIAEIRMGQSPDSSSYNEKGIGPAFLQGCAEFGAYHPIPNVYCSAPGKIAPEGSLLISVRAPVGDLNVANQEYCIGRGLAAIIGKQIETNFIHYSIDLNKAQLARLAQGSTFDAVGSKELNNHSIRYPECPKERCRLVEILETSECAIEKAEALIAKYEQIKQGMMQDLFTRGVDKNGQLRPPYEEAPNLYKETELGWLPKEWEVVTFSELLKNRVIDDVQDGNHGELHPKTSDFVVDGVPFLMANDIDRYGHIDFENCARITFRQYQSLRIGFSTAQDVLLTHKGTVGRVAKVPNDMSKVMLTPQVTYYRIKDKDALDPDYLYFFFSSPYFQALLKNLSTQSTRAYIGITEQKKQPIIMPPQGANDFEQSRISQKLSSISSFLDAERARLKKLNHQKAGLMQDLLTGKVPVSVDCEERSEAVA